MPCYAVRLGRLQTVYEIATVEVDASNAECAAARALDMAADGDLLWTEKEWSTPEGGEIEAESATELKEETVTIDGVTVPWDERLRGM